MRTFLQNIRYRLSAKQTAFRVYNVRETANRNLEVIRGMIASVIQGLCQNIRSRPSAKKQASTATATPAIMLLAISVSSVSFVRRCPVTTETAVKKRVPAFVRSASLVRMPRRNAQAVAFYRLASARTRLSSCARRSAPCRTRIKACLRSRCGKRPALVRSPSSRSSAQTLRAPTSCAVSRATG